MKIKKKFYKLNLRKMFKQEQFEDKENQSSIKFQIYLLNFEINSKLF